MPGHEFAHRLVCCYVALVGLMDQAVYDVSLEADEMPRDCLNLRNVRICGIRRDPLGVLVACP